MTTIRIAGAKLPVSENIPENERKICAAIERAAADGADILLTPEGSLSGYTHDFDVAQARKALENVTHLAQEKRVGLALGTCYVEDDGKCYNQIRFYLPDGTYLGFHSKTLTCGSWDDPPVGEINHYTVSPLRTFQWPVANGASITIGGLICNDLWANPACTPMPDSHLTQQLSQKGARIIFHAVNGGRNGDEWSQVNWDFHASNLRMRTLSAKLWIVTVDNSFPLHWPSSAPSGVIGPDGSWVCETPASGEQYFVHTIELAR